MARGCGRDNSRASRTIRLQQLVAAQRSGATTSRWEPQAQLGIAVREADGNNCLSGKISVFSILAWLLGNIFGI
jgi:hypothetical protein